ALPIYPGNCASCSQPVGKEKAEIESTVDIERHQRDEQDAASWPRAVLALGVLILSVIKACQHATEGARHCQQRAQDQQRGSAGVGENFYQTTNENAKKKNQRDNPAVPLYRKHGAEHPQKAQGQIVDGSQHKVVGGK